jgi:predicted dehydrogenase/aryl-alcohol dehydrogenase-like predicted oxidoreductase
MTDQKTVAWGILGPGRIAGAFARDLPASRTGRLLAVGSRDLAKAQAFAQEHGAERAYGSYEELLADAEVDAVYIATPHPMHAEWAIKAAEAGKHILCEKPLTVNLAETMAVIEAAKEHDVFLMEAYMYRTLPQTKKLVELIRDGAIGQVHQIHSHFAFGAKPSAGSRAWEPSLAGGGILDVGGYVVTSSRLVAGAALGLPFADPTSVTAVGTLLDTSGAESPDGVDGWTSATLTFDGGITAHLTTGVGLSDVNHIRVVGSKGFAVVPNPWLPGKSGDSVIEVHRVGEGVERIEFDAPAIYAYEADEVAAHLADRQAPAMNWADTLATMKVLDQWRAAIKLSYPQERLGANYPPVSGRAPAPKPGNRMKYGEIPGVGKRASRLVMGCDNQTTLAHGSVMFDDFFERGGNTFDTGWLYGRGIMEKILGQWIRNRGLREDVVVIGKGMHTPWDSPEYITPQLEETLERLQTDYVDVYFMHRDNPSVPVSEFVDVLDGHVKAGRIKAYGGSNWALSRVAEANAYAASAGKQGMVAVSNQFSLARTLDVPWKGCLAANDDESRLWLEKNNFVLMPWSSQARGFFTGRAAPDDRSDEELVRCWYSDDNFVRLERARQLAKERGVAPTAVALSYVQHQEFPTFPLIGPRQLSETVSSLDALKVDLTPEEVRWLDLRD